jgi:hypothetical protein
VYIKRDLYTSKETYYTSGRVHHGFGASKIPRRGWYSIKRDLYTSKETYYTS